MVTTLPDCQESTEAFVRGLYDDAFRPLLRFVLLLTGNRERAEEVVQETMVRAWRQHATKVRIQKTARLVAHRRPTEAAHRLGIPVGTVKSRSYHACASCGWYSSNRERCNEGRSDCRPLG